MAYVNVAEWKPDQVTEWLKGLDSCLLTYMHAFLNNLVDGQQLLSFGPNDLEHLGVHKIGHQEIILEGIEHLRNIHYELDRENLQLHAMRLSCLAHSLHNELCHSHTDTQQLSTQIIADISTIVTVVKPLIAWLDRPGFCGETEYESARKEVLRLALRMATCGQRDRFVETPVSDMKTASAQLAKLADNIVQDMSDPLILQPASLDLATIKKRSSDDLGFYIVPPFRGIHKISDIKLNSAAHQSGKIEPGDEIIQINYQTVVGWSVKEVMSLFAESPTEVLLTLKKRPRHTKIYGQIYVKPYRLPSKKRAIHQAHTADILSRIHYRIPIHSLKIPISNEKKKETKKRDEEEEGRGETSSDDEVVSVQHNLVVPSKPVHRRATITGASPLSKRPPFDIHELWHEMKLEKESSTKQSTTSVVDFEERLSSSARQAEGPPLSSEQQQPESNLETMTIKQKIEMFSRENERTERKKVAPPSTHPVKPQIRINSEPIFDMKVISEVAKIIEKPTPNRVAIPNFCLENKRNIPLRSSNNLDKRESKDILQLSEKRNDIEKNIKVDNFTNEINNEKLRYEIPDVVATESEEHGKVVQTINRHLLMNKLSDDSDIHDYPCYKPKQANSSSNSLPLHGKSKVENYERKTTHSLPTRGKVESDSDLSQTISKVIHDSTERTVLSRSKVTTPTAAEQKQFIKMKQQSIFYNKSYSSESLDKAYGDRGDPEITAFKYGSLQQDRSQNRHTLDSPPVPPPRPSLNKPSNACYRAAIIAARALGKASPKAQRKKHPSLAKGRNVTIKEFNAVECQGWLLQRCRKGSATWNKRWCLIHANTLYTFHSKQSTKAETLVCLPGFTAAPAEEVKSRPFAFKVYHTGTMFYFAAETNFELSVWLDAITTSTLAPNPNAQAIVYSESEGEEITKKVPTPAPRPPSSDSTGSRMFGSLKKLGSGGNSNSSSTSPSGAGAGGGSSLDRKCLRLLGPGPLPVPTAQYRSYRRVHNTAPIPPSVGHQQHQPTLPTSSSCHDMSESETPGDMADYRLTARSTPPVPRRRTVVRLPEIRAPPTPTSSGHQQQTNLEDHTRRVDELPPSPGDITPSASRQYHPDGSDWVDSLRKAQAFRKKIKMKKPHINPPNSYFNNQCRQSEHPQQFRSQRIHEDPTNHQQQMDYPGLEYPPVFEPGTYTLDTSSLLVSARHHHQRRNVDSHHN
ncbi:uncharacterized protein cnk [Halyomorpha halys]|uniref:uncharacterized protein cnk n=1 Tax=Halyomorpha halys TaxID=286706 RepID=UPI0006D513F5|nr:uncharacterized protein LOC106682587 [Halyomorpha halys]